MDKITSPTPIAILLATYNGGQYLMEQLDSLLQQTCQQWTLYIHDDGSTDNTNAILQEYAQKHSNIHILGYESQKGAMRNFLSLLQRVEADYYMFCDQDDVWLKQKVELSFEEMKRQEAVCGRKPIIVYTDLYVTDAALNITCNSFWQEICLHPEFITTFDEMAASTAVTGCAMLFNQQVKDNVVFPAAHATMHDAWITACTLRKNGKIIPISQPLVYYRQHEDNCVGSDDLNHIDLAYRIRNFRTMQRKNLQLYRMLRSLGYGSIVKFFYYKWKYKQRIQHKAGQ